MALYPTSHTSPYLLITPYSLTPPRIAHLFIIAIIIRLILRYHTALCLWLTGLVIVAYHRAYAYYIFDYNISHNP